MASIALSARDIDALSRTARSEVGHFGKYGPATLKGGVEAVVDTIINRVAHRQFPNNIEAVVNAPFQFSAIGAPGGTGRWDRLPAASSAVRQIVENHLAERVGGKASSVEGAAHFLNPHLSSQRALRTWGDHVVQNPVAVWGQGRDIHYHGYAPRTGPPSSYSLIYLGASHAFSGEGFSQEGAVSRRGAPERPGADAGVLELEDFEQGAGAMADVSRVDPQAAFRLQPEPFVYHVERLALAELAQLEATLNRLAEEGWRLIQMIPDQKDLLLVMEGVGLDCGLVESDDALGADFIAELSASLVGAKPKTIAAEFLTAPTVEGAYKDDFAKKIDELGLKHFKYDEFLVLGGQHFSGPCKGKNEYPPRDLWDNILPTARVLDSLREKLGAPINTTSVYRSAAYNACIPGAAGGSVHMKFQAVDFTCADGRGPAH